MDQAIAGLAQEGKVICVRLALFAEMMKGKTWTPSTLNDSRRYGRRRRYVPGRDIQCGYGPPEHRYHQKAARAILKALLPESGTDIKGHMRSYQRIVGKLWLRQPSE